MVTIKDRLPHTIRIKKRFAASPERLLQFKNGLFALVVILLAVTLLAWLLSSMGELVWLGG